jgi:tetratricopeptide (TPR) repeat protein
MEGIVWSSKTIMTANNIPSEERQRYTDYYLSHLKRRLDRAIAYIRENPQPIAMREQMRVWLGILSESRRPELHPSAVTLILLLHPWPLQWGYWEDWEQELSFAIRDMNTIQAPQEKAELLTYLADMMYLTGRRDESLKLGKLAFSYACSANAMIPMARSGTKAALILLEQAEEQAAADIMNSIEDAIREQETRGNLDCVTAQVYPIVYKARQLRFKGRLDTALVLLTDMLEKLKSTPKISPNVLADCYSARSAIHWSQGESLLAIDDSKQAIALASLAGYEFEGNAYSSSLGMYYWTVGELKAAEETLLNCIRREEQANVYYWLAYNVGNLALVFLSQGRIQDALVMVEQHIALAKDHTSPAENMRALDNYGIIKFHAGDYLSAQTALEQNIPIYENQTTRTNLIVQLANLSRCYRALSETDRAINVAEKAFEYAEQQSYPAAKIIALRCLAEIRVPEESKALLYRALALARQCHKVLDEAACLLSLAGLEENENQQKELWTEGTQILTKIGASAWLEGCSVKHPPKIALMC